MFADGIAYNDNPGDWIDRSKIMIPLDDLLDIKSDIKRCADNYFEGQFKQGMGKSLKIIEQHLDEIYDRLGIKNSND